MYGSVVVLQVESTVKQDSFKFTRCHSGLLRLTCCFEFEGVEELLNDDTIPEL